ncbi:hypothetical protein AB0L40_11930 [Patulibacter sp. NPDC049589]|uniref:hypothetical protein n=1 Tax=Patulibacter sp. NPDC049589 TaxID=3154731 RepID=UPI003432E773
MRRLIVLAATTLAALSAIVVPASAKIDSGQGLVGENNDLMVTLFGFAILIGIPAFALLATLIQSRLDKRKYARLAAVRNRKATSDKRLGW